MEVGWIMRKRQKVTMTVPPGHKEHERTQVKDDTIDVARARTMLINMEGAPFVAQRPRGGEGGEGDT